jgi:hypothetical protein
MSDEGAGVTCSKGRMVCRAEGLPLSCIRRFLEEGKADKLELDAKTGKAESKMTSTGVQWEQQIWTKTFTQAQQARGGEGATEALLWLVEGKR